MRIIGQGDDMYVYLVWRERWNFWFQYRMKILEGIYLTRAGAKKAIGKKFNRTIGRRKIKGD